MDVTLQVVHPALDLSILTERLLIQPVRTWRVGEPRTTPKDRPLGGVWPQSSWCGRLAEAHPDLEDVLDAWLGRLESQRSLLLDITATGGRLELVVSLSGRDHLGESFPPGLLGRLASLGVGLGVAFYRVEQR